MTWSGDGWEQHREDRLRRTASATPLQRLRWLEEAIAFAQRTGALRQLPSAQGAGSPLGEGTNRG